MLTVESSYAIVKWTLLGAIVAIGIFMSVIAIMTWYIRFIVEHPIKFILEAVVVGVLGALPIFLISWHRDALSFSTTLEFLLLAFKFIIFWFLVELTGTNAMFFRGKDLKRQ